MYAQRSGATCTVAAACLPATGGDVATTLFLLVGAFALICGGWVLMNIFRAKPEMVMNGPKNRK